MSVSTVSVINKSIHTVEDERGKFSVHVYVNGKFSASHGWGTREWAELLAGQLANNDCPKCSCPHFAKTPELLAAAPPE